MCRHVAPQSTLTLMEITHTGQSGVVTVRLCDQCRAVFAEALTNAKVLLERRGRQASATTRGRARGSQNAWGAVVERKERTQEAVREGERP